MPATPHSDRWEEYSYQHYNTQMGGRNIHTNFSTLRRVGGIFIPTVAHLDRWEEYSYQLWYTQMGGWNTYTNFSTPVAIILHTSTTFLCKDPHGQDNHP